LFSIGPSFQIDYASHAGGALAGVIIAGAMLLFWRNIWEPVGLRPVALVIVAASIAVLAYGAVVLYARYDEFSFQSRLIPPGEAPAGDAEFRRRSEEFVKRYPDDPRARYQRAVALIQAHDHAGAEREARRAMEIAERYPRSLAREFRDWTRLLLAATQHEQGRVREAKATASSLCGVTQATQIKTLLTQHKLCE
jgi:rhomboid protease GluP